MISQEELSKLEKEINKENKEYVQDPFQTFKIIDEVYKKKSDI